MVRPRNSFDRAATDRGVSEVIGSILVFGLVIALLALVQTQVVPNANEGVEATHATEVRSDIADLQASISRSASLGGSESVTVRTGTTYPPRLVLFNPPPVQGTLSTGDTSTVDLSGFGGVNDDTDEFIGTDPSYDTHTFSYRVDYNRYENAPTTRYEHSVLVSDFGDQATVESRGSLVSGNRISLTLLRGGLQESRVSSSSVSTYPVSAPPGTVRLDSSGTQPTITLPTNIDQEVWVSEILAGEFDSNALPASGSVTVCGDLTNPGTGNGASGDGRFVVDCSYTENANAPNRLTLRFQADEEYDLRTAKVGFSADSSTPPPAYMTNTDPTTTSVEPGGTTELTVEVRDRFNNPLAGVPVTATTSGSGSVSPSSATETDGDGQVRYTYTAPAGSSSNTVTMRIQGSSGAEKEVTFQVNAGNPDDTKDPVVTTGSTAERTFEVCNSVTETNIFGVSSVVVCDGAFVTYEQTVIQYDVYDKAGAGGTPSGLDYVTYEVRDSNGNIISSASRQFGDDYIGSGNAYSGRFTTAYLPPGEDAAAIEITVYDDAGRKSSTTVNP